MKGEAKILTLAGFMDGPVYSAPATMRETMETEINKILRMALRGPLTMTQSTARVTTKVSTPFARAPPTAPAA